MAATTKLIVYNECLRELGIKLPLSDLVTANSRLTALDGAFDHAVEYCLSRVSWTFAKRRATLTGTSSTAFPPYTYVYTRPSDWLRTIWIKTNAYDDAEIDYAEIGASIYGFLGSGLIEYVSDHADNYDPANWPPHFTRVLTLYLAYLVAPGLARAGDDQQGKLWSQYQGALSEAEQFEDRFLVNAQINVNRHPTMRRAIQFMGQVLAGSVPVWNQTAKLRWEMNQSWDHSVRYVLEQGAWNYASRRVRLTGGTEPIPGDTVDDIIEGYSVPPATEPEDSETLPEMSEYDYGFVLPSDFLHKIWCKADANHDYETDHQFLRDAVYANVDTVILEYVSKDSDAVNPDNWPASFMETVAAHLAMTVAPELMIEESGSGRQRINATGVKKELEALFMDRLRNAKIRDAIQQQPKRMPLGAFASARLGGRSSRRLGRYN